MRGQMIIFHFCADDHPALCTGNKAGFCALAVHFGTPDSVAGMECRRKLLDRWGVEHAEMSAVGQIKQVIDTLL